MTTAKMITAWKTREARNREAPTLQRISHLCIPFMRIAQPQSQLPHSCVCERFIYSQDRFTNISCSRIGRSILGIYKSLTDTRIWKLGLWPRNSFSGSICFKISLLVFCSAETTLQRQNAENLKQIFPEKEYRGLSPYFHIHVSVSELHIPSMGLPLLLEEVCRLILGIYKSLKDTWMWKLGLRPRYSQKRNIWTEFPLQCRGCVWSRGPTEKLPRDIGHEAVEDILEDVLQGALYQVSQPVLRSQNGNLEGLSSFVVWKGTL
jgi:hypothetical protein